MRRLTVVVALACLGILGAASPAVLAGASGHLQGDGPRQRSLVIRDDDGELARVPLTGDAFAVSYRNSIYQTLAEERYEVLSDGSYCLVELAADQLAVLEEYYGVPGAPAPAADADRRAYVVPPSPTRPARFRTLSIAATDLGERTIHVPGAPPLELWRLVGDDNPFVVLDIEETP